MMARNGQAKELKEWLVGEWTIAGSKKKVTQSVISKVPEKHDPFLLQKPSPAFVSLSENRGSR